VNPTILRVSGPSNRRAAVLLVVIVCVAITSLVFITLLQLAVAQEDAIQSDARQLQASWLAESALDRGAAKLRADHAYQGETWNLPGELLSGRDAATAEITIETVPGSSQLRRINVQLDYPADAQLRSRQNRSVIITLRGNEP
jgi:hypothetical protein